MLPAALKLHVMAARVRVQTIRQFGITVTRGTPPDRAQDLWLPMTLATCPA
jgi:hypothetical protein